MMEDSLESVAEAIRLAADVGSEVGESLKRRIARVAVREYQREQRSVFSMAREIGVKEHHLWRWMNKHFVIEEDDEPSALVTVSLVGEESAAAIAVEEVEEVEKPEVVDVSGGLTIRLTNGTEICGLTFDQLQQVLGGMR